MGGGTTIQAPQPDPQQQAYFAYMLEQQKENARKTAAAEDEEATQIKAVKATGTAGYNSYKQNLLDQYDAGIINSKDFETNLRDYEARYKLGTGYTQQDIDSLIKTATGKQAEKTKLLAGQTYKDILGRAATEEELTGFQTLFKTGEYKLGDLVNTIKSGSEYQNKFNDNYLSSYYDTMYGKQGTTTDEKGLTVKTGKRTFTYDPSKDPFKAASGTTAATPGTPTTFTGTPAEIEEYQQALRQKRQFDIDSGLISLQGEIDKNVQKIKNEGAATTQRIAANANVLSNLTQGFWS
jgi:hypothetical protein